METITLSYSSSRYILESTEDSSNYPYDYSVLDGTFIFVSNKYPSDKVICFELPAFNVDSNIKAISSLDKEIEILRLLPISLTQAYISFTRDTPKRFGIGKLTLNEGIAVLSNEQSIDQSNMEYQGVHISINKFSNQTLLVSIVESQYLWTCFSEPMKRDGKLLLYDEDTFNGPLKVVEREPSFSTYLNVHKFNEKFYYGQIPQLPSNEDGPWYEPEPICVYIVDQETLQEIEVERKDLRELFPEYDDMIETMIFNVWCDQFMIVYLFGEAEDWNRHDWTNGRPEFDIIADHFLAVYNIETKAWKRIKLDGITGDEPFHFSPIVDELNKCLYLMSCSDDNSHLHFVDLSPLF